MFSFSKSATDFFLPIPASPITLLFLQFDKSVIHLIDIKKVFFVYTEKSDTAIPDEFPR